MDRKLSPQFKVKLLSENREDFLLTERKLFIKHQPIFGFL
jgi:hypothetical protein